MKKMCRLARGIFFAFCMIWGIGFGGEKKAEAKVVVDTTPVGTQVELVIPKSIGSRDSDRKRMEITDYYFAKYLEDPLGTADDDWESYSIRLQVKAYRLPEGEGNSIYSSVLFLDQDGHLLNHSGDDFSFGSSGMSLNRSVSAEIVIRGGLDPKKVAKIVFMENWVDPERILNGQEEMPAIETTEPEQGTAGELWQKVEIVAPRILCQYRMDDRTAKVRCFFIHRFAETFYVSMQLELLTPGHKVEGDYPSDFDTYALFYDSAGKMLNKKGDDTDGYGRAYFWNTGSQIGCTDYMIVNVADSLAGKVKKIVFQEHCKYPKSMGSDRDSQNINIASSIKTTVSNTAFKLKPSGVKTNLKFKSSNKKIAEVVSKKSYGLVKLHKPGKVKITIEAEGTEQYEYAKKTITLNIGLAKPKLKVSVKNGTMTIQWNKVPGAVWYEATVEQHGVKTTILQPTKKMKFANNITLGKTYTVKVRAVDQAKKHYSGWSSKTLGT